MLNSIVKFEEKAIVERLIAKIVGFFIQVQKLVYLPPHRRHLDIIPTNISNIKVAPGL